MREAVQRKESHQQNRRIVSLGTGYKRPRLSAMPSRIVLPPEPTAKERSAREVQQAARVEMLLLKGVTNKALIGRLLGIKDKRKVYVVELSQIGKRLREERSASAPLRPRRRQTRAPLRTSHER